jgi:hypothetical protein
MLQDFEHSGTKDMPNVRTVEVGTFKARLTRTDPYGFIHVSYEKGLVPRELSGVYTTFVDAERACTAYAQRVGK